MALSPPRLPAVLLLTLLLAATTNIGDGLEILSKSSIQKCGRDSGAAGLSCDRKLVLDMAVPTGSSGREASLVAQVVASDQNDTKGKRVIRDPPIITINKSDVYALHPLTYLQDVAYKPEEYFVETHKCEPDAGADVVHSCERLWNENGSIISHSEPVCCPCGNHRVQTSCGNIFDKLFKAKGKPNTAHCVRFPGERFQVFDIGARSIGFSIRIQVKIGSSVSEVVVGPDNRTAISGDNFLRVNIIGDFKDYTDGIPSFDGFYLVTPRKGASNSQPQVNDEYSRWMLVEKLRFTEDGLECDKIGVGYEAYQNQPSFCSSPIGSCLHNQLWNFMEDAGDYSFAVGVKEVRYTNIILELRADDIQSPGKIIRMTLPTFEALQVGVANVTTKNIGQLEASYSLTLKCSGGINPVEEQFFIMKANEVTDRLFHLHTSTNQAAKHRCAATLKASNSSELDISECEFNTTATVVNNGTQVDPPKIESKMGFLEEVKALWHQFWDGVVHVLSFFTSRLPSTKAVVTFGLCLASVLAVAILLHREGFFSGMFHRWELHEHARHRRRALDRFYSLPNPHGHGSEPSHHHRVRTRCHRDRIHEQQPDEAPAPARRGGGHREHKRHEKERPHR
ncbi:hypothetical protein PR202_gb24113 [Eleusine coracana subsp. coracana]|uniref:Generative cell specific-1/HAP2 domain-containing protein n=1 Tax=Eleusine coracana subsp. coracana TaxID=191504 RepID=A0AAV5FHY8_ELECO|nr:hypothetical protein PR202_gb24113 [Eleusine coracana subsp. coracana]